MSADRLELDGISPSPCDAWLCPAVTLHAPLPLASNLAPLIGESCCLHQHLKTLLNSRVFLMLCRQTDSNLTAYRRHHAMHGCALRSHCTHRYKMQAFPLAVGRVLLPPSTHETLLNSRVFLMLCRQTDSNLTAYRRHHAMHGCALRSHCTRRYKMQAFPLAVG